MSLSPHELIILHKSDGKNLFSPLNYEKIKNILASLSITFFFHFILSIYFPWSVLFARVYNVVFYVIWTQLKWLSGVISISTEACGNTHCSTSSLHIEIWNTRNYANEMIHLPLSLISSREIIVVWNGIRNKLRIFGCSLDWWTTSRSVTNQSWSDLQLRTGPQMRTKQNYPTPTWDWKKLQSSMFRCFQKTTSNRLILCTSYILNIRYFGNKGLRKLILFSFFISRRGLILAKLWDHDDLNIRVCSLVSVFTSTISNS
jgi:hypothetical protein